MQTIFLLATAFNVSVDSFLCGLSLQAQYKGNFKMLIGIMLSVFLLCFIGSVSGYVVGDFLQNYSNLLGGIILYGVSILNTQPEKQSKTIITNANGHIFKKSAKADFSFFEPKSLTRDFWNLFYSRFFCLKEKEK